jgi:predicted aspartyl protease
MADWIGYLDSSGTPRIKITIKGPVHDGQEFDAVIDTGFTGFLSIPLLKAFPLGLLLHGTTSVVLADGSTQSKLTALAIIKVDNESVAGVSILELGSSDVLVGMDFLRLFKRVLFVHCGQPAVTLLDQVRFDEAMAIASKNEPDEAGTDSTPEETAPLPEQPPQS